MKGKPDGLIHKSKLPEPEQENIENMYRLHDSLKVKVINITQKGVSLALVEKK